MPTPTAKPRVLIIDDEPVVLHVMRLNLESQFDVTTVGDGLDALSVLHEQGPFDAIICDLRMPVMDGVTFLTHAQVLAPQTPRIALTGYLDPKSAAAAVSDGRICRYFVKPCPTDELQIALHEVIAQTSTSRPLAARM